MISVIITAYNRREFIRYAVNSVLKSKIPKDEYEIIVVKNFHDNYVDKIVKTVNGKIIFTNNPSIGFKIKYGIEAAQGDVIALLEDDDAWLPERLSIINEEFRNNPSLIYYHNNVYVINENNEVIYDPLIERTNISARVIAKETNEKLQVLRRYGLVLGFRNSSIAVRSRFIKKWADIIKLFPDLLDALIYLLALADQGTILHDPRRLTYYRVTATSASSVRAVKDPETRLRRALINAARQAVARHMLLTLVNMLNKEMSKYVGYYESTVIGGIWNNWGRWISNVLKDMIRCRSITCIGAFLLGLTYLVSPWLGKRATVIYYTKAFRVWV